MSNLHLNHHSLVKDHDSPDTSRRHSTSRETGILFLEPPSRVCGVFSNSERGIDKGVTQCLVLSTDKDSLALYKKSS